MGIDRVQGIDTQLSMKKSFNTIYPPTQPQSVLPSKAQTHTLTRNKT
jgi:hypothetical protein